MGWEGYGVGYSQVRPWQESPLELSAFGRNFTIAETAEFGPSLARGESPTADAVDHGDPRALNPRHVKVVVVPRAHQKTRKRWIQASTL